MYPLTAAPCFYHQAVLLYPIGPQYPYYHSPPYSPTPLSAFHSPSTSYNIPFPPSPLSSCYSASTENFRPPFSPSPISDYHSHGRPSRAGLTQRFLQAPQPNHALSRITSLRRQASTSSRWGTSTPGTAPQLAHPRARHAVPLLGMSEEGIENHWNWWLKKSTTNDVSETPDGRYGSPLSQQRSSVGSVDTISQTTCVTSPSPHELPQTPASSTKGYPQKAIPRRKPVPPPVSKVSPAQPKIIRMKPVPPLMPKAKPAQPKIKIEKPLCFYSNEKGNFLRRYIHYLEGIHGRAFFRVVEDDETAMWLAADFALNKSTQWQSWEN